MAPSKNSRQENTWAPEVPIQWTLPVDVLLEIAARADLPSLVRCAATCKLLRRDLLSPQFIHRVIQAAPCILAYWCNDAWEPLTLVHPTIPAVASLCHDIFSRFLSRKATGTLLGKYKPVLSHHGFVVLQRQNIKDRQKSARCFNMCVYNPMSGAQTILSNPPAIRTDRNTRHKFVLLTAADGIGYSFLLLVCELYECNIRVHTTSPCGTWNSVTHGSDHKLPWYSLKKRGDLAILNGGVIHWLACLDKKIPSYDFRTGKTGSVKLPPSISDVNDLHLVTSSDRKRLKLLAIQGFMMFVWLQLPVASTDGRTWSLEIVIDMEKLRSLYPYITSGPDECIEFEGSGNSSGDVVFLEVVCRRDRGTTLIVFDLETKMMHKEY